MTGMENVLAAHGAMASTSDFPAGTHVTCMCDWTYRTHSDHATHVAEALDAAGFGNLHDAWAEGHRTPVQRERSDCRCGAWCENECACGKYGTGKIVTPNPYPKVSET